MIYYFEYYKRLTLVSVPVLSFDDFLDVLKENKFYFIGVEKIYKVFNKDCFKLKLKYNGICFSAWLRCCYGK